MTKTQAYKALIAAGITNVVIFKQDGFCQAWPKGGMMIVAWERSYELLVDSVIKARVNHKI